jgi:hypothetical protein
MAVKIAYDLLLTCLTLYSALLSFAKSIYLLYFGLLDVEKTKHAST